MWSLQTFARATHGIVTGRELTQKPAGHSHSIAEKSGSYQISPMTAQQILSETGQNCNCRCSGT